MKYLMCNLKSNKSLKEILEYKKEIKNLKLDRVEFVLFPSTPYLGFFYDAPYNIGSQNISVYENGFFTGEVLASQLKSLKVKYVIVNHSDNNETNSDILLKVKNATKENIKVVLIFGEKERATMEEVIYNLRIELHKILSKLESHELKNIILAYEPVWAIKKNTIPNIDIIDKIVECIKEEIDIRYHIEIKVLYGGGINNKNKSQIKKLRNIDGYLLGSYAQDSENIAKFLKNL